MRLCALADLPDPGTKGFRFREGSWLFAGFVLREGAEVKGFIDQCPHAAWPLAALDDRYLTRDGRRLLCSGHGALFRLDGVCVAGPCVGLSLTKWPVVVESGDVLTA